MHKVVKRGISSALTLGLVATSVVLGASASTAAAPEDDLELVRTVSDIGTPSSYVLSSDYSRMFTFNHDNSPGTQISIPSLEVVGQTPAIASHISYGINSEITIASGDNYVARTEDGYTVVDLASNTQFDYAVDVAAELGHDDEILAYFVSDERKVTAFTASGAFLTLDGEHVTDVASLVETPIDNDDSWIAASGATADGALFFFTLQVFDESADFPITSTMIVDTRSGRLVGTIPPLTEGIFTGLRLDISGEIIWGEFHDADGNFVGTSGYNVVTGELEYSVPDSIEQPYLWLGDAGHSSILFTEGRAHVGRDLDDESITGSRALTLAMLPTQIPGTRDLIFINSEFNQAGIIVGKHITDPVNVDIAALGETVEFTSTSRGLALEEDDAWLWDDSPRGSIWQSSSNGTDWADIPGETGTTLAVTVTADNYNTEYRRHFNDGFWGRADSAPVRAVGPSPQITRADDLPPAKAGTLYPAQTITATGQDDLAWSLAAPTSRATSVGLPAGMSLSATTGEITGTPTAAGEYEFTVHVKDVFGTDAKLFRLSVAAADVDPSKPEPGKPEPGKPTPTKPGPGTPTGALAHTGSAPLSSLLGITAALIAAGVGAVAVARRKTSARN